MFSLNIFITICIGVAAAGLVKRQDAPPPPTNPPMQTFGPSMPQMSSSMVPPATTPAAPQPISTMGVIQTSDPQPQLTNTTMMVDPQTSTQQVESTTTETITSMDTSSTPKPIPTTTKKPTIDELVSVDEILEVFGNIESSDYFKKLSFEDQTLIMEILAGGETGKMSPILESVETKRLLTFLYNLPFKYSDSLWRVITLGYYREEIIAQ